VRQPFYAIRIMNPESIALLKPGETLFSVERFVATVNPHTLNSKGTDASNVCDEEVADEEDDDDDSSQGEGDAEGGISELGAPNASGRTTTANRKNTDKKRHPRHTNRGGHRGGRGAGVPSRGLRGRPAVVASLLPVTSVTSLSTQSSAGPAGTAQQHRVLPLSIPPVPLLPQPPIARPLPPGWPSPL